jgi:hypothetical protein
MTGWAGIALVSAACCGGIGLLLFKLRLLRRIAASETESH